MTTAPVGEPADPVAVLRHVHAALRGVDLERLWALPEEALGDGVELAQQITGMVAGIAVALVGEADARGVGMATSRTRTQWIVDVAPSVEPAPAARLARVAAACTEPDLAALRAAVVSGAVPVEHADAIAAFHTEAVTLAEPRALAATVATMVEQAPALTRRQLRIAIRYALAHLQPAATQERLAAAQRAARAFYRTGLAGTGMSEYRLVLDPEGAALMDAAIDPLSAPRPDPTTGMPDPRPAATRRADALMTIVEHSLGHHPFAAAGTPRFIAGCEHVTAGVERIAAGAGCAKAGAVRAAAGSEIGTGVEGNTVGTERAAAGSEGVTGVEGNTVGTERAAAGPEVAIAGSEHVTAGMGRVAVGAERAVSRPAGPVGVAPARVVVTIPYETLAGQVASAVWRTSATPPNVPHSGRPDLRPSPSGNPDSAGHPHPDDPAAPSRSSDVSRGVAAPIRWERRPHAPTPPGPSLSARSSPAALASGHPGPSGGAGISIDGHVLTPETVRRLACDAEIIPAVLGGDRQVLELGRSRRLVSAGQRTALWLRDRGCTFPGCTIPAAWTRAHHVIHWAAGGATDLGNLALLCQRHHTEVHARRLTATVDRDAPPGSAVTWHA